MANFVAFCRNFSSSTNSEIARIDDSVSISRHFKFLAEIILYQKILQMSPPSTQKFDNPFMCLTRECCIRWHVDMVMFNNIYIFSLFLHMSFGASISEWSKNGEKIVQLGINGCTTARMVTQLPQRLEINVFWNFFLTPKTPQFI